MIVSLTNILLLLSGTASIIAAQGPVAADDELVSRVRSGQATRDSIVRNLAASRTSWKRAGVSTTYTYTCPAQDNGGHSLGQTVSGSGTLYCSYPTYAGEDPNNHYCGYSTSTGVLTITNNAPCPGNAVGTPSQRRSIQERAASRPGSSRGVSTDIFTPAGVSA